MSADHPPSHPRLPWKGRRLLTAAALVLGLGVGGTLAFTGAGTGARGPDGSPELTVLTRNLYLGVHDGIGIAGARSGLQE